MYKKLYLILEKIIKLSKLKVDKFQYFFIKFNKKITKS
jgi:hypothetical protein